MSNPFEFVNNINASRDDIWSDETAKSYNAFLINRALSYHLDTVFFAQEMNQRSTFTTPKMQYDFLRLAVQPKKKRFASWAKEQKNEFVDLVCEVYQVNKSTAAQYLKLLSEDDLKLLQEKTHKGGMTK